MTVRTIKVDQTDAAWQILDRLAAAHPYVGSLDELVGELLDHVQQGVYRSGSWERGWLAQCVPEEAIAGAYVPADDPRNQ